ncbi:hypothetical protein HO133_000387 [Letharia lupina]|uniref:Uncharacterized protein n=1 Tax=Letharia lupina TaxID=560253 RepID=A0A8H6CHE8_9LECA|nr:uncharacterized protein HO133_000387 [Letharia lupina]KAF6223544.1 hypothetical protein HO133_000387 [Letharia lupina]
MERNHFDRLSAELITPILLELPTTQTLYSLIRASPKAYQVFLASKETILISLMRRRIRPAAFIDALAAVQASQLKDVGPDRKAVLAFLRTYENKRHKTVEQKGQHYSLPIAVPLCQLYQSTQYFIEDLTSRSNCYLRRCRDTASVQNHTSPQDGCIVLPKSNGLWRSHPIDRDHCYAPLSDVEEGRLQRAFFRYELYTNIFSSDMEYSGEKLWELPSDSHFFLENYQQWEIEELACVEDYRCSLLSNSFDRIESSFVGIQLPEPPLEPAAITSFRSYERSAALREAKFQIHSLYPDYLSNLSLPFLHHALQLDRLNMQREMSSHIYYDGQKRSLSTALEGFWKEMSREDSNLIHNYIHAVARNNLFPFKDTIDGSNEEGTPRYVIPPREQLRESDVEDALRSVQEQAYTGNGAARGKTSSWGQSMPMSALKA